MVCVVQVDTVKRMCVKKLPKVLVIQLKRFDYDWERCVCIGGMHLHIFLLYTCVLDLNIAEKWLSSSMIILSFHENWTCLHTLQQLLLRRKVCDLYTVSRKNPLRVKCNWVLCRGGPFWCGQ